jgi:hypothetical protein
VLLRGVTGGTIDCIVTLMSLDDHLPGNGSL